MTIRRHFAVIALFCALAGIAVASDLTSAYTWKPMKIGGGGWVTGLDINPSAKGLMYARTDVSGAYRRDASASTWQQVVTTAGMPPGSLTYGNYGGVDSLVGAPGSPDIAYMAFAGHPYGKADGEIYRSTDRGTTWKATGFRPHHVKMEPNGEGRQEGERLAVDPLDSNTVYYGSIEDGLWVTRDGGAAWTRVPGIPSGAPDHGVNTVVFDRTATTSKAGNTQVIFVTVDQGGVFRTADAGATWTKISDPGPGDAARPRDAEIGPDHTCYVACDNAQGAVGAVWKYSPDGTWTNITPPGPQGGSQSYWEVAVDPTDARRVVAMINGGRCFVSHDGGASWTFHGFRLVSPRIRWQDASAQDNDFLSTGEIAFDPFVPGRLWFAEGFGVWWADDLSSPDIVWHSASEGIEEACGNDVVAPPGSKPVAAMWDLGAFCFDDVDTYTARRSQRGFMSAWALDWCPADPRFLVGVFRSHLNFVPHAKSSGYSTDGGHTWIRFAAVENNTIPDDLDYGVIAVSANSPDHIVWAPTKGRLPCYTTDRGATWKRSVIDGATATAFHAFTIPQKPLAADRVLADTFYLFIAGKGVFRSTDGGARFERRGNPLPTGGWNGILKATPGHAGDLWLAEGASGGLFHSTDGGATWTVIKGMQACNVGLGKPRVADGYPTLFVAGVKDGRRGIFRSTDGGRTWDQLGDYPLGITDWIDAMDGDKDVFGKVYVCFAGAGFAYGAPTAP